MKTKVLKFVLPVFAILMAVSFAFASKTTTLSQMAHYFVPELGWNSMVIGNECGPEGTVLCKYEGNQLYFQPSFDSIKFRKND